MRSVHEAGTATLEINMSGSIAGAGRKIVCRACVLAQLDPSLSSTRISLLFASWLGAGGRRDVPENTNNSVALVYRHRHIRTAVLASINLGLIGSSDAAYIVALVTGDGIFRSMVIANTRYPARLSYTAAVDPRDRQPSAALLVALILPHFAGTADTRQTYPL